MRATCTAVLNFGLLPISFKLYLAASAERQSFCWMTPRGNRVRQKYVDEKTGEEISRDKIVYAVELGDKLVQIDPNTISSSKKNKLEIQESIRSLNLRPEVVEKTYYLGPDKNDKEYHLLYQSLFKTKKSLVCKWWSRDRDHLTVIATGKKNILMLYQLYYLSEIREPSIYSSSGGRPIISPTKEEINLAEQVVNDYTKNSDLNLSLYQDEYGLRLSKVLSQIKKNDTSIKECLQDSLSL